MKLICGEDVYELKLCRTKTFRVFQKEPYIDFDYKEIGKQGFNTFGEFEYKCIIINGHYFSFKLLTDD